LGGRVKKGYFAPTQTIKRGRGRGKIHLGITPGGQRTVCKCENNFWVELKVVHGDPLPLNEIEEKHKDQVCKLCLGIAKRVQK